MRTCRHDDSTATAGCPSICLRLERSRSTPRGPDDLAALLADGISVVVAGVDGLRHATVPANIGDTVEVIADVSQVKTRIVFDQYVAVNGAPAAFARISCVCRRDPGAARGAARRRGVEV